MMAREEHTADSAKVAAGVGVVAGAIFVEIALNALQVSRERRRAPPIAIPLKVLDRSRRRLFARHEKGNDDSFALCFDLEAELAHGLFFDPVSGPPGLLGVALVRNACGRAVVAEAAHIVDLALLWRSLFDAQICDPPRGDILIRDPPA
jgi:hypothetical protein